MIAEVLDWKFNSAEGICTKNGVITQMPVGIKMPTDAEIAQWTDEYNAYKSTAATATQASLADRQAVKANAKLIALRDKTPAQIQAYIDANINTLADAKDLLKTIAILIGLLARDL